MKGTTPVFFIFDTCCHCVKGLGEEPVRHKERSHRLDQFQIRPSDKRIPPSRARRFYFVCVAQKQRKPRLASRVSRQNLIRIYSLPRSFRRPFSQRAEAIRILQRVDQFFSNVLKLIKVKGPARLTMTKNLTLISRESFALYFDPSQGITPRVYEALNLPRYDNQVKSHLPRQGRS